MLAGPDGALHHYDKIHPFTYSGEHEHYDAGDAFLTVEIEGLRVSFFVCYDLRFADEFWALAPDDRLLRRRRELARVAPQPLAGAPDGTGDREPGLRRRREPRRARAQASRYAGDSMIIDPLGETLVRAARAPRRSSARRSNAAEVEKVRAEFPFLQDRR